MQPDMGWPDLLSKLAVVMMMMIDNLVSPMISPRKIPDANATALSSFFFCHNTSHREIFSAWQKKNALENPKQSSPWSNKNMLVSNR
jgi:hypothetical protein